MTNFLVREEVTIWAVPHSTARSDNGQYVAYALLVCGVMGINVTPARPHHAKFTECLLSDPASASTARGHLVYVWLGYAMIRIIERSMRNIFSRLALLQESSPLQSLFGFPGKKQGSITLT
jgi:hypothetical protein